MQGPVCPNTEPHEFVSPAANSACTVSPATEDTVWVLVRRARTARPGAALSASGSERPALPTGRRIPSYWRQPEVDPRFWFALPAGAFLLVTRDSRPAIINRAPRTTPSLRTEASPKPSAWRGRSLTCLPNLRPGIVGPFQIARLILHRYALFLAISPCLWYG